MALHSVTAWQPCTSKVYIPLYIGHCTIHNHVNILWNLLTIHIATVLVENFEVFLISRFSWVADDTKIIHVEGGINTREIF